ncbi:MAG: efflux RND transporter permease subunit [Cellvibrionaceae bacterium]
MKEKKATQSQRGIASWSIRHPVGVSMIASAVIVLGLFTLAKLAIDLLPHIIYPEIRVRILDSGVPASVMEDRVTRQLEEQLAVTEDAISVQSTSSRGSSQVDLAFNYGKDIDVALRDASTRLDRAKRFLPDSIDPPVIFKLDPAQIPIMEFVISSPLRDGVELRSWVDDTFSKWFLNLPGVAAAEVGGGLLREIQVIPDQRRLAGIGLTYKDIIAALQTANSDEPIGRLQMPNNEMTGRISGRFKSIEDIKHLPILNDNESNSPVYLSEVADVIDTHEDERIKVRADGVSGIKLSIQKQPAANTTEVVELVKQRLQWLQEQQVIPDNVSAIIVADQSVYIVQALKNASLAAISGALLAMSVVYIFLGNLRRTFIIGSAIPIAIMFTCLLMGLGGLTLNIMTLGGLALGIGMLVDNTIVMLENVYRHQCQDEAPEYAASTAATEVNGPIVAATSTNLAAVIPFLFIGGLTGLLFRELIFTISAAIFASMIIALTLVPAYAAKVKSIETNKIRSLVDSGIKVLQNSYARLIKKLLPLPWLVLTVFVVGLCFSLPVFVSGKHIFLPKLDDGRVRVSVSSDVGISLEDMDSTVRRLESIFSAQVETDTVFTLVGGSIFGRSQRETPSRSTIIVQLKSLSERGVSSAEWIKKMNKLIAQEKLAGFKVRMFQRGIRGIRTNRGDDDISLRLQGENLKELKVLADSTAEKMRSIEGLKNITHSAEDEQFEIAISLDRERAAQLGIDLLDLTEAAQIALQGRVVSDYLDGDKAYDIRLKLSKAEMSNPQDLESIILFPAASSSIPVYLGNVAQISLLETPASIKRDNQMRIVELSASLEGETTLGEVLVQLRDMRENIQLPFGYTLYDGGSEQALQEQQQLTDILLLLALFLVFVVMAIQYESLLNPLIIIISVPFSAIGVAIGIYFGDLPLSMPVWLGMIMLVGIVVNNAILLVEYIEIERKHFTDINVAIIEAARLRLRPILMTTLSTVMGMLPLAIGVGDGAEMLQPLAIAVVCGLSFSMLVSLLLVPMMYRLFHANKSIA